MAADTASPGRPGRLNRNYRQAIPSLPASDLLFLLFFSILTGAGSGLGAVLFRWLLGASHRFFFHTAGGALGFLGPARVILLPALGGLAVGPLIHFFSRESKGTGVPEVMLAVASFRSVIRPGVVILKILVSSLCIGSGGSAGREGPIVQSGSAVGSMLGSWCRLSEERTKILVACGAAGGVAATFNAPLGGIFFALEIILGEYRPRHFSAVVLSSVTATELSRRVFGDVPVFGTAPHPLGNAWSAPLYLLLGAFAALAALLFVGSIYRCEDLFDSLAVPPYAKAALGGAAVGLIGWYLPAVFGVGYGEIERLLGGNVPVGMALLLLLAKIAATSVTLGSGGSGGVFAPCLFVGATFGDAAGQALAALLPGSGFSPGGGAVAGMGAVFAAAAQAPITSILLLAEMTGNPATLIPLMLACIPAALLAGRLQQDSIYTRKLMRRGVDIARIRGVNILDTLTVAESMTPDVRTLREGSSVTEAAGTMARTGYGGFPVLDGDGKLVGVVTRRDIEKAVADGRSEVPVAEAMTWEPVVCFPEEHLRAALEKMGEHGIGRLPVVAREDSSRLVGLITRNTAIAAFADLAHRRREARDRKIN